MMRRRQRQAILGTGVCLGLLLINGGGDLQGQDANGATVQDAFAIRDADEDGTLSLEELLVKQPEASRPSVTRDFRVVDWNQDGKLSRDEFFAIPSSGPQEQRTAVPDPVSELCAERVAWAKQEWPQWDRNADGMLDQQEFESSGLRAGIPGLASSAFADWNLRGEGGVTQDDATKVIEAAYGVRRLDGFLLRKPNGLVFNWVTHRWLDINSDDRITVEELTKTRKLEQKAAAMEIARFDRDEDGSVSIDEAWGMLQFDSLQAFLDADRDWDGKLSKEELLAAAPSYHKAIAALLIPAFDADGDRKLDFQEYRLCPLANYHENWYYPRQDRDHDGYLSREEFRWRQTIESAAMVAIVFGEMDVSKDDRLSLEEFVFRIDLSQAPADVAFAFCDKNRDGILTLEELQAGQPEELLPQLARNFQVVNWNRDGGLSQDEYRSCPAWTSIEQRTEVPDPVSEISAERVAWAKQEWPQWDRNADSVLDQQEFDTSGLRTGVPGLTNSEYADWNLSGETGVIQKDATRVIEAAFGIRRLDGFLLRKPNGQVFNWMSHRWLDANRDDQITIEELMEKRKVNRDAAAKELARYDQNQDNSLSIDEAWGMLHFDSLKAFLDADRDWDGKLSKAELLSAAPSYQKVVAASLIPAFDTDGDGNLDFHEYRLCPLANFHEDWHSLRQDRNHDGQLAFQEFTWGRKLDSCAYLAFLFDQFDISQDECLSLDEFAFRVDFSQAPADVLFSIRDKNRDGSLTLEEIGSGQPEELLPQLARDFRIVDWNGDGVLSQDEYRSCPAWASVDQRTTVPDPVSERCAERVAWAKQEWPQWDRNADGMLDQQEFESSGLRAGIPGLASSAFSDWNLRGEGGVTQDDATKVIEAAYGVRRLDGFLLRKPNGLVFNLVSLRWFDADNDDRITVEELADKRQVKHEAASVELARYDQNQDGSLSLEEAWGMLQFDSLKAFLDADRDWDGKLSKEELLSAAPSYHKVVGALLIPAFDADGDGKLDLREYRLCPLANYHENWHYPRQDRDHDGHLSWEEFRWRQTTDSAAMVAIVFGEMDVSGDGLLDSEEFHFNTSFRDPEREFRLADVDQNGLLPFEEFLSPKREPKTEKRDFTLFDANADGRLSYDEYLSVPSRTSLAQRRAGPDPVQELADAMIRQLETTMDEADRNHDGLLTAEEFRNGRLTRMVPGLQLSRFQEWDLDQDGTISPGELRRVIHAAYGVRRLDGLPYRDASGVTYSAMNFHYADADHDDRVSRSEFLERGFAGSAAAEMFQRTDTDQNGFLSFAEWIVEPRWTIDPITQFLEYDKDLSGGLSHAEVMAGTAEWQHMVTSWYLGAFDDDNNGELSLVEYRRVPMVNLLTTWHSRRDDRDGDGALSFSEFHDLQGIERISLTHEYFRRLDRNGNGKLDLDEFDFRVDINRAPSEIAFRYSDKDQNHLLSLAEVLIDYQGRTDVAAQSMMGRMEEAFLAADTNRDRVLSSSEFEQYRDSMTSNARRGGNTLSTRVSRTQVAEEEEGSDYRLWVLIAMNVLLVGGAAWYVLAKR